ncbi:MAG: fumarate hydratase [candidate division KSB1 bacterium]|nr:fumarate hydratase [candidate division KSB1 bacterium]
MRIIQVQEIAEAVSKLCIRSNYHLPPDVRAALDRALKTEVSEQGRDVLAGLLKNADIASGEVFPLCQDTGVAVFIVEMGAELCIEGGTLSQAIQQGVKTGYRDGYLRKSMVRDPLQRGNTGDNTPPVIWTQQIPGDKLHILMAPKGGGSENMSGIAMLKPSQGRDGVMDFIVKQVEQAGGNPCPPVIVGVGIGGTFEKCAWLAKKALFRRVGERHPDVYYAEFEEECLERINDLGIGPMGFGGRITALDVQVQTSPCHIASLPVAVNIQCHSARHMECIL